MGLKTTSEEAAGAVNQQQIKAKLLGTGMTINIFMYNLFIQTIV